jgi:hypothetical protein
MKGKAGYETFGSDEFRSIAQLFFGAAAFCSGSCRRLQGRHQLWKEHAGRLAGRRTRAAELSGAEDEKDLLVRPLGRARGGGPGLGLGFRNAVFPPAGG